MEVPVDIWLYIAGFIEDDDLRNLFGLNRVFFDIAMDIRWNKFEIRSLHGTVGSKYDTAYRLREPHVAARIKQVIIKLDDNNDLVNTPQVPEKSWKDKVRTITWKHQRAQQTIMEMVISLLPNLVNVCAISIQSVGTSDTAPFFDCLWSTFANKLQRLTIEGTVATVDRSLFMPHPNFPCLTDIEVELMPGISRVVGENTHSAAELAILNTLLVPLINQTRLQSFKLMSWLSFDISTFFSLIQLGLPNLTQFWIRAPFDTAFASEPDALAQFLHNSPNLVEVRLRLNSAGREQAAARLGRWLTSMFADDPMRNLRNLHIHPSPGEGFVALTSYLKRSAPVLSDLTIRDRYLTEEQFHSLLAALDERTTGRRLKAFRFNLLRLTPETLGTIYNHLPSLSKLYIFIGSTASPLDPFILEVSKYCYLKWTLSDLGIWTGGQELPGDVMLALAGCIPSLHSFWGNGNKKVP